MFDLLLKQPNGKVSFINIYDHKYFSLGKKKNLSKEEFLKYMEEYYDNESADINRLLKFYPASSFSNHTMKELGYDKSCHDIKKNIKINVKNVSFEYYFGMVVTQLGKCPSCEKIVYNGLDYNGNDNERNMLTNYRCPKCGQLLNWNKFDMCKVADAILYKNIE